MITYRQDLNQPDENFISFKNSLKVFKLPRINTMTQDSKFLCEN